MPKNSTFKPLSTIFVSCMKIQGRARPPAPRCRHPWAYPTNLDQTDLKKFWFTIIRNFLNQIDPKC